MLYGLENLLGVKKVYVFGAGENGQFCGKTIKDVFPEIEIGFLDNSHNDFDVDVIKPDALDYSDSNTWIVIYSEVHYKKMYEQLIQLGCSDNRIIFTTNIALKECDNLRRVVEKRIPPRQIDIVFDVVEHCNLNCQNCDHFSSIAEPFYADIEEYERDLKRLTTILGDDETIREFFLAGGEPLLHRNLTEFIEIAHNYLHNSQICIFTNAILLERMHTDFWDSCQKCKVKFYVTKYPIDLDFEKIRNTIEAQGLECVFEPKTKVRTSMHKPLDLEGKQDIYNNFHKCYMGGGRCTALKHGKLYTCTLVPNLPIFNKYFNKGLAICSDDYIDLNSDTSKMDVMKYLCNPIPGCRYCKVDEWTYDNKWKTTEKTITEWT